MDAATIERFRAFARAIASGPGTLDAKVREAAVGTGPVEGVAGPVVDKIRHHAYKVTDEDIAALRAAGLSEDQIFELSIAAAVGAGSVRLEAGLAAARAGGK